MYYHICEYCGARLDPGEECDCIIDMAEKFEQEYAKKENAQGECDNLEAFSLEIEHFRYVSKT